MRRRDGGEDGPPGKLLVYRAEDWPDPREWSRARRAWLRQHARTIAEVNRLYGPEVVFPPDTDPRTERRIAVALHPGLRDAER